MPSKAKINITGHAGKNAEHKDVGKGLTTFSVATSKGVKKDGEWENVTTWFSVKVWGEYGKKLVGKILKGDIVDVTGDFEVETWTDKEGNERTSFVVRADNRDVLPLTKHDPPAAKVADTDDLPF